MDGGILIQDIFHVKHEFAYNFKAKVQQKEKHLMSEVTNIQIFSAGYFEFFKF